MSPPAPKINRYATIRFKKAKGTTALHPPGELKRIPRRFHQIALQIRFCRRPHIHVVRFRWPGFLPTHVRRLIKRQFREFPQPDGGRHEYGSGGSPAPLVHAPALAQFFRSMYVRDMKAAMPEPEIVTRKGKPVSVIIPIENYEELLERVEDAGDVAWLKRARRKPLHYRPLEEYMAERSRM
jgi:prevent-host-death family protein